MMTLNYGWYDSKGNKCIGPQDSELYTVYSISPSGYQLWQADLLDFSFTNVRQPGILIRVVSGDCDEIITCLHSSVKNSFTLLTPDFSLYGKDQLLTLNKAGCINYMMQNISENFISRNAHSTVFFVDPDMIFLKQVIIHKLFILGEVYGQQWIGYTNSYCRKTSVFPSFCPSKPNKTSGKVLMFPIAFKLSNLRLYAKVLYKHSRLSCTKSLHWMSDMTAFITAINQCRLQSISTTSLAICNNWDNSDNKNAYLAHYCQPMYSANGELIWDKRSYNNKYIETKYWPVVPIQHANCFVDRVTLEMINKMRTSLANSS